MAIQFHNGGILFDGTSIAMDPACCCNVGPKPVCCPDSIPDSLTISASGFSYTKNSAADCGDCSDINCNTTGSIVVPYNGMVELPNDKVYRWIYNEENYDCSCTINNVVHYFRRSEFAGIALACRNNDNYRQWQVDYGIVGLYGFYYQLVYYKKDYYAAEGNCFGDGLPVTLNYWYNAGSPTCDSSVCGAVAGGRGCDLCCLSSYPSTIDVTE